MTPTTTDRDALTADLTVGILGVCAFAVSFTHVVQTATEAGQTGWVAYAIAVSVELMALGAVAEIRRRKRHDQPARWPRGVLVLGVAMSLAANLAVARPTPWGYVMAAWPSLAFLAAAGIIESRPSGQRADPALPRPADADTPEHQDVAADPPPTAPLPAQPDDRSRTEDPVEAADETAADEPDEQPATKPLTERPSKLRVITDLLAAMRADPDWRPDYDELTTTTGYSRSWCEKRVSDARTLHGGTESGPTQEPPVHTGDPQPRTPIRTARDADDQPLPPTSLPAPNPYEEPAHEHHPPHTAAAA
ncbi:hypothetical protein C7C46_09655 [Streptomyces tateyamensis]|uniref:DUF2637 domain-containing protein n=1 Tax=Streptomyces tateyamensis TaxID=565073 RepID=A0A2V4NDL2_9ACTN|nr:DUF2637 domain-containing protein [Streptomyces tateyamensis]PYC82617.1 hypothetical protein C7C46_09655 [Streptomyces tateyamensis]